MANYEVFDTALESIASAGPDLRNGLTNHAPMASEALCALGRGDAVMPWLDRYRKQLLPWPAQDARIDREAWQTALGHEKRVTDWREFFADEMQDAPWREVLDRWTARLAPGISANATHGVIRVAHAARALALAESRVRLGELADGLASWAATYQRLPTDSSAPARRLRPSAAITEVAIVPPAERVFTGTITGSLERLADFPPFAPVIGLAQLDGDPAATISELTETFARVYLANASDVLTTIVFVHGVTSVTALRSILPHVGATTAAEAMRYAWQAGCGLYAAFGQRLAPAGEIEPPRESADTLIDMAIASGDEHAIKFTEACLREHALNPSPAYLSAARHTVGVLKA